MGKYVANPDLEICTHNDTVAVRPSETGRLRSLVEKTEDGRQRVWVFKGVPFPGERAVNYSDLDHHTRGLVIGSGNDWHFMRQIFERHGFSIGSRVFNVPLANGQKVVARTAGKNWRMIHDYTDEEIELCRADHPTVKRFNEAAQVSE